MEPQTCDRVSNRKGKKAKWDQMNGKLYVIKQKKIEDFYIESDHIIDNLTDTKIIIRLGEDSSDSDSGDSGSSSSLSDENDNLLTPGTSSVFSRVNVPGCSRVTNDNLPAGVSFIDSGSD
ncbi:unnamed protein product [Parnassius apollo]|uniref:(apollo) hypothetical protein n=1 Tax=Parnassius apollo TaxID=110799 RepID=A0A8S3WYV3_PARAO|nr:unnamed protein product [Parnassius apollo]